MPVAVITGANSGLGFAVACRLITAVEGITIVVTCRSTTKAKDTLRRLQHKYPAKTLKLDYALLDLASMRSVHDTAKELKERFGRIDYLYLNAGAGDFIGLDWKQLALDFWNVFIAALTAPTYKLQRIGRKSGDGLGWVFQCNVFGHFYLMKELLPVMKDGGKVIWTSSLEAFPWAFSYPDPTKTLSDVADASTSTPSDTLQLLTNTHSYEGSKRITDVLHIASYKSIFKSYKVRQYLTHPGICGTNIMADHLIKPFFWGMFACFYLARLLGSVWHTCTAHKGALSSLYCAVIDDDMSKKFGSGTDRSVTSRKEDGFTKPWTTYTGIASNRDRRKTQSHPITETMPARPLAHLSRSIFAARPLLRQPVRYNSSAATGLWIQTEQTPNVDALKFIPGRPVLPNPSSQSLEFKSGRDAMSSPLARKLFTVDGVKAVFFGPDFITVTKSTDAQWPHVKPEIFSLIMEHITAGLPLVSDAESTPAAASDTAPLDTDSEDVAMIKELLDTRIRPTIQEDGGDVEFREFRDGWVYLKLKGACSTCDSSTLTLRNGIESMLMHYVPSVEGVQQVLDQEEEVALKEFEKLEARLRAAGGR
ncbi:hypothetical protein G7K_6229-t1 [Saitoella complicata NRRL Y-17804]|uniref:3beta-hydroxysteroid 3-dehydrogenase n=2 Tax=Saitoella complicata (strain BCRC 22490 / CBS 7301 / JCM 7358 / NBRC 10748 / NRRL Y-17804) TaxID=698492 RepID=A0A0E9NQR9_SAICN|nr:hypothetical protein G7K_6229-t1 [Saitoella complicata NRRL Y-17804]